MRVIVAMPRPGFVLVPVRVMRVVAVHSCLPPQCQPSPRWSFSVLFH
jgi:hypothetical protein